MSPTNSTFMLQVMAAINLANRHPHLFRLKSKLNNCGFDSVLLQSAEFAEFENELFPILNFVFKYRNESYNIPIDPVEVQTASEVLSEIISWLNEIIKQKSFSQMVLFYSVFSFFDIPISQILTLLNLSLEEKKWFVSEHFNLFHKLDTNFSLGHGAPYSEGEFYRIYKEGIAENNLKKIYELVFALERGMGYNFPFIILLVAKTLFELDINLFYDLVNSTISFPKTQLLIEAISAPALLLSTVFKNEKNIWLIIEIVRYYASLKNTISTDQAQLCALLLKRMSYLNDSIFWQFIMLFNDSGNTIIIFAETFTLLNEKYLLQYATIIKIDEFFTDEKSKSYNIFFDILYTPSHKRITKSFCEVVNKRWHDHLDEYVSQEKFANDIIHTNIENVVLKYLLIFSTPNTVLKELNKELNKMLRSNLGWYKNSSQQQTYYFVILTKIYVLSHALKYTTPSCSLTKTKKKLQEVILDKRKRLRFHSQLELPQVLSLLKENISFKKFYNKRKRKGNVFPKKSLASNQ